MFCEYQGEESLLKKLEAGILHRIASVQSKNPELISASIYMREDYGLFRSFRRCSNSEALNKKSRKLGVIETIGGGQWINQG